MLPQLKPSDLFIGTNVKVARSDGRVELGTIEFMGDGGAEGKLIRLTGHHQFCSTKRDKITVIED